MRNNLFEAIYNNDQKRLSEIFNGVGQYYQQADEEINRDKVKAHLMSELNKLKADFEKIIPTDPDTYKKYEALDRALRGYH